MPDLLKLISPADAWAVFKGNIPSPEIAFEKWRLPMLWVGSQPDRYNAAEPLPAFTRSSMDGYAVVAADTYGASESLPVTFAWWVKWRWEVNRHSQLLRQKRRSFIPVECFLKAPTRWL